jgi:formylglycine-generating enzyme required for sulfatase activity
MRRTSIAARLWPALAILLLSACQAGSSTNPAPSLVASSVSSEIPAPTAAPSEIPRPPSGPQAGTQMLFTDGSTLVYIPAGDFQMGGGSEADPVHGLTLDSYWMQRTEVTDRMYSICTLKGGCPKPAWPGTQMRLAASAFIDTPIVGLTWEEAGQYCKWIGGSLPTEAQWEKAAAGMQHDPYPWGEAEPTCDLLNFNDCIGAPVRGARYADAGSPYGLLDMAGNVSEWTADWYAYGYYKESSATDPTGPDKGEARVVRGGNYASTAAQTTVWARDSRPPGSGRDDLGFRCVVRSPQYSAPYCRTSRTAAQITPGQARSLPDHCSPATRRLSVACATSITQVEHGTLTTVSLWPIGELASCNIIENNQVYCVGTHKGLFGDAGIIDYCVTCPGTASDSVPDLGCPAGYTENDSSGLCEYQGRLAADDCPLGSQLDADGTCLYAAKAGDCPQGMYFDQGAQACVTVTPPNEDCIKGFTFSYEHACCQVQGMEGVYPTCSAGEYVVPGYGCLPVPDGREVESCSFATVSTGECH